MDGENIEGLSCHLDYDIWRKDANEVQDGSMLFCAVVGYLWTEEDWPGDITPETLESEETMGRQFYITLSFAVEACPIWLATSRTKQWNRGRSKKNHRVHKSATKVI